MAFFYDAVYDVVAVCGTVVVGQGSGFTAQFVFIFSQIDIDFFTDCIGYFVAEKGNGVFSGRRQPVLGAASVCQDINKAIICKGT